MEKAPDAFRTISEVATWLDTPAHVLRFWESKFSHVKPVKRAGGRRYYRPADMLLLGGIKRLLHEDGLTIKGVQKILREEGVKHVSSLSQSLDGEAATPAADTSKVVPFTDPQVAEDAELVEDAPTPAPEVSEDTVATQAEDLPAEEPAAPEAEPVFAATPDVAPEPAPPVEPEPPEEVVPDAVAAGLADEAEPPEPTPIIADVADDPADDDVTAPAARLATLRSVDRAAVAARASQIRPLMERLESVRARMG